ncbi:10429_t:CDS:2, partial [Scutellospora calospora]
HQESFSKDLKDVDINSSKEFNNSKYVNIDTSEDSYEKSNNLEDVNMDFLEESNYSQENNDINFSEEFISDDSYLEHFTTISSESSNNLANTTNAYDDLINIIHHPHFNIHHVVKNIRRFKDWRHNLPLMPIYSRTVNISAKKTSSNSKNIKDTYYLSIKDIIWHVLNNPSLMKYMYFGPGCEVTNKTEYWHGSLWAESSLYGQDSIKINKHNIEKLGRIRAIIMSDNTLKLKVQKIIEYHELPKKFYNDDRQHRSQLGEQRINANRIDLVPKSLIKCWVLVSKSMQFVFKHSYSEDDYMNLQQILETEVRILTQVFEEFVNLPNLNINAHLALHAQTYGNLINIAVGIKEMVHRIFKSIVPRTNCKNIELDLLKCYTTLFAIRHLIDGGIDSRSSSSIFQENELNDDEVFSQTEYMSKIKLRKKISLVNQKEMVLSQINSSEFKSELMLSYQDFGQNAALINKSISFYQNITYLIENEYGIIEKCSLSLGDIVTIEEEEEEESFAMIKAIFRHKSNDGHFYAFIMIDWFENTGQINNLLECPIYKIQSTNNKKWRRVFPLSVVDNTKKVHFVHNCLLEG